MNKRSFLVRCLALFLIFGVASTTLSELSVDAQRAGAESSDYFQEVIKQTSGAQPVFGPESALLPYEAYEDCPECTWAAGLSTANVRVHLNLDWQGSSDVPGGLFLAIRQSDPQALDVDSPNFISIMGTTWLVGGEFGELLAAPRSVDVVANGSEGFLGIDGVLMQTFDLSQITGPGDVVLTAGSMVNFPGGRLGIENFTVWDLNTTDPTPQNTGTELSDEVPGMSTEDSAKFDEYRVMALFQPMLYGPTNGDLVHDPSAVSFDDAEVTVADFMAHATCSSDAPIVGPVWDCGFAFRDLSGLYYTVVVLSSGEWRLSQGTDDSFQNGEIRELQIESPQTLTIDLVVAGATGYLGVNDRYVATLDLSAIPGPGTVALGSAFYESTTIASGKTNFADFGVVSLDDIQGGWYGPSNDASAGDGNSFPGVSGNTYTDATFPFSLTWDDTWSVADFGNVDGTEMLTLTNGPVTAEVYGAFNTVTALDCLNNLLGYYHDLPGYSNVAWAVGQDGQPVLSGDDDVALGLMTMTVANEQGVLTETYDYATCLTLVAGQSLVRIEQFVSPGDYLGQLDAMNALQLGLGLDGVAAAETPEEPSLDSGNSLSGEGEAAFEQYISQTSERAPVFGPAPAVLVPSFAPDGTWEAGISLRDIRLHADVGPGAEDLQWGVMVGIRRGEEEPLITDLMQDSDVILIDSDGYWQTNEASGYVDAPVTSFDVVGDGDQGYLSINGHYVTDVDMTLVIGPGEVVLAAITDGGEAAPLPLDNVTVWDLTSTEPIAEEQPGQLVQPGSVPAVQETNGDAATFAELLTSATGTAATFGPDFGSLVHTANDVTLTDSGVSVTDFAAHVECTGPASGSPAVWDCGFYFRDLASYNNLRLIVRSDGDWTFGVGASEPIQSGEGVAALDSTGTGMTIDLVVKGDTGYFAVNSNFVSTLYVADVPGPGSVGVASAYFTDTFAVGSETGYSNFSIWSLDAPAQPQGPTVPSGISGQTYTSPTYGYMLTWDETWAANGDSSADGKDELSITNGPVTAVLSGAQANGTGVEDCFLDLIDAYRKDPAYSEVGFVTDESGMPLTNGNQVVQSALLTMTITQEGAEGVEVWDYAMCAKMDEAGAMVVLEQLFAPGSLMHQQTEMESLQSNLWLNSIKSVMIPGLPDLSGIVAQPTDEDISNFAQMSNNTIEFAPIAGPSAASLTLDQSSGNAWAAGVTGTDVWVRVNLANPPSSASTDWQLLIQYRAAGYGSDSVTLNSDGTWDAGQVQGTLTQFPHTIDLLAFGETGYLAFDGNLVAMLNISYWMQPGDVIVSAGQLGGNVPGATLDITDVSVWNMNFDDVVPAGATAVTYFPEDAPIFASLVAQESTSGQSVFGPTSGVMNHNPGEVNFQRTELALGDFAARIVCLVPQAGPKWDCGFVFGNLDTADQYRIGVISDGTWFLSTGTENPLLSGGVSLGSNTGPVTIDLVVSGVTAYLGVNSEYVATLDVSQFAAPRNLAGASAFFADTSIVGGGVVFEQFQVWSLDSVAAGSAVTSAPSGQLDKAGINSYSSPNFGYGLTWNDSWSVLEDSSEPGFDHLALTNGSVYADLYSVNLNVDATACNEDLFQYYLGDSQYANAVYMLDENGNPLVTPGSDMASAWLSFVYTNNQGVAIEYADFAVCAWMPDRSTMVQFELRVPIAELVANQIPMQELVAALNFGSMPSGPSDILDQKSG